MADTREWKEIEQQILDALDIASEYQAMGVTLARSGPTSKGWQAVHAVGRDDKTASAAIFVGRGDARGRYRDMGGEGLSASLWEFAGRFGGHGDWREARKHFAHKAGVKLPSGGEPKRPDDQIEFLNNPSSDLILENWAGLKGGFDLAAVKDNGGVYGRYPKKAKPEGSQYVVCFPGHNPPGSINSDPAAWVIANTTAGDVTIYKGQGRAPTSAKTLSVGGSVGSLLGKAALKAIEDGDAEGGTPPEVVWKVEGLSDMLCLYNRIAAAGFQGRHVVISNSQGTLETVKPEWVELLKGRTVYVCHDADRPGRIGAERWCQSLVGHAKEVRHVVLPFTEEPDHGKDLRNFLHNEGHPYQDLLAIAEAAGPFAAPQPSLGLPAPPVPVTPLAAAGGAPAIPADTPLQREDNDLLKLIGMDVIGEYKDGEFEAYSRHHRKVRTFPSIDRFSYRTLVQFCGEPARLHIHDGKDHVEGKETMERLRIAIASKAGGTNLTASGTLGQGIWRSNGHFVLVNGGTAALYDRAHHALGAVTEPKLGPSTVIDFSATEPWVDFLTLQGLINEAGSADWCRRVIAEARDLFSQWRWKHPQDATNIVLLIAASYVQTIWPWRPEVSITGPSDCGKSSLMMTMQKIFGRLEFYHQKPSEAGLRQRLGNSAKVIMVDEFENDHNRQKILEFFRTTSQGGTVLRGTSDQKGRSYGIRHIPWVAAIESGLTRAADRNRFIILDLESLPKNIRGHLRLPDDDELAMLGFKLCALAIRHVDKAIEIFSGLKRQQFDTVHGRVVESFSVPAALKAAAENIEGDAANRVLGDLLADRQNISRQGGGDEQDLMKSILDSTFIVGSGLPPGAVSDVVSDKDLYQTHHRALESNGIALTEGRSGVRLPRLEGKRYFFFDVDKVKRYLLRNTAWAQLDCEQLLLRVKGANRVQRMISGSRVWGIEVPLREWIEERSPEENIESYLPLIPEAPAAQPAQPEPEPVIAPAPVAPQSAIDALMGMDLA